MFDLYYVSDQVQLEEVIGSDLIANSCQIAELDVHTGTVQDLNEVKVRMV